MSTCADCRFYDPWPGDHDDGECRRYAPKAVVIQQGTTTASSDEIVAIWPSVLSHSWCGDFEAVLK
jgi:hypothetical protein